MELLSVREVAELKGCSEQYIRKMIAQSKLAAQELPNPANNIKQYAVPVTALPADLQATYYNLKRIEAGISPALKKIKQPKNAVKKAFEEYSTTEREEITLWCSILGEWQNIRAQHKNKTKVDPLFVGKCQLEHPGIDVSVDILYRKYKAYKNNNLDGLVDKRGGWNRGKSEIKENIWDAFLSFYFEDNEPTVTECYNNVAIWAKIYHPELVSGLPTERTFRRHIASNICKAIKILMREGEKAFRDRCLPYVGRLYDNLHANELWVADNHTLDVQSINGDGKTHRLHYTTFMDMKSGVVVGGNITDNPCSQSTILALRNAILAFGIPDAVLFDNGSEFLTHDVGGRGHRTRKNTVEDPPTILQHLGIEMRNAQVRNAKAKPIERFYGTLKNQFSRQFTGFCGGTILERKESLKRIIKNGELPTDLMVREHLDMWIKGDYNLQAYGGVEPKYEGMSRLQVWEKSIDEVGMRTATEDELNLMLMRSTRYQKIKRDGVFVDIYGEKLWYHHPEQTIFNLDKEVYIRYDPANLTCVRIYDKDTDKYLYTWALADKLMLDVIETEQENIKDSQQLISGVGKFVRSYAKGMTAGLSAEQRITMLDIKTRKQYENIGEQYQINLPTIIIPYASNDEPQELPMAVGAERVAVDLNKMNRKAEKRKE